MYNRAFNELNLPCAWGDLPEVCRQVLEDEEEMTLDEVILKSLKNLNVPEWIIGQVRESQDLRDGYERAAKSARDQLSDAQSDISLFQCSLSPEQIPVGDTWAVRRKGTYLTYSGEYLPYPEETVTKGDGHYPWSIPDPTGVGPNYGAMDSEIELVLPA